MNQPTGGAGAPGREKMAREPVDIADDIDVADETSHRHGE